MSSRFDTSFCGPAFLRARAYTRDVTILKRYGDVSYKLLHLASVRTKGVELENPVAKGSVNDKKLNFNICRARSKVREYGLCNDWDYFLTLTLNPDKHDRFDLQAFKKSLSQWVRDYRKKHGVSLQYLLIPEQHKNGAWHMHGFIMGLPLDHLELFSVEDKLPYYILEKLKKGEPIYSWPAAADKFGFLNVEPIRNRERAVNYITKYITKDLEHSVKDMGAHLFYASQGLKSAAEMKRGYLAKEFIPDFENDYCKGKWFPQNEITEEAIREYIY